MCEPLWKKVIIIHMHAWTCIWCRHVLSRIGMDRYERKLAESARILTARDANTTSRTMSHGSVQNEHVREQPTLVMFWSVFVPCRLAIAKVQPVCSARTYVRCGGLLSGYIGTDHPRAEAIADTKKNGRAGATNHGMRCTCMRE